MPHLRRLRYLRRDSWGRTWWRVYAISDSVPVEHCYEQVTIGGKH